MNDTASQASSPKSIESNSSSKFKTLKKKIRNKFRLSRGEDVRTIAQAVETLKRSDEILSMPNDNSDQLKNEFKELKETLESIVNQNQVLAEVVKTVDSSCPDPFSEPEKFSFYFAQKSISNRSLSDEFDFDSHASEPVIAPIEDQVKQNSSDVENAILRLQNLRMEEQRSFQIERQNYETRLGQLVLLQQEIEFLRKENADHQIQLDFLKSNNSVVQDRTSEIEALKSEILDLKENHSKELNSISVNIEELNAQISSKDVQIAQLLSENETIKNEVCSLKTEIKNEFEPQNSESHESDIETLKLSNIQLQGQLEETLLQLKTLQETLEGQDERDRQFRELSEENVRLKIEFEDLKKDLKETKTQLADLEKEPISLNDSDVKKDESNDESAFKYVYLSNLVLKFMQFPEQRTELANIILTTLQTDQPHFQKIMGKK